MQQLKEDHGYGKRLEVEIDTPAGLVTIELRSDTCIYAHSYTIRGEKSFLELPGVPETLYIAGWRMVKVDGEWIDWIKENIEPNFLSTYHRRFAHGKHYSQPAETKLGLLYCDVSSKITEVNASAFAALDALVRPCIIQWLNDNPKELRAQGIRAAQKDVDQAKEALDNQRRYLASAQEKYDKATERLRLAQA